MVFIFVQAKTVLDAGFLPPSLHAFMSSDASTAALNEGALVVAKLSVDTWVYLP